MTDMGPVQFIAVEFGADARFEGRIVDELARLEERSTLRVLDVLFVRKDEATGELRVLELEGVKLGAVIAKLLGLAVPEAPRRIEGDGAVGGRHVTGLGPTQVRVFADALAPGHAAGFLLVELLWAAELRDAIRDTGGAMLGEGLLGADAIAEVAGELEARRNLA
jgi:hypothetical protein